MSSSASLVMLAPRPVAPGDILFGCGPIQDVLTYPGQPKVSIAQDQVDACKETGLGGRRPRAAAGVGGSVPLL